jgi:DNA polymerase-3 subunit delta'
MVAPAEAMNAFAANSLLKTLEEPAASTVWLLVSEQPRRLPQTVRSRCQQIPLAVPAEREALPWLGARLASEAPQHADDALRCLRLAHGAPLRALRLVSEGELGLRGELVAGLFDIAETSRDPVAVAADWQRHEPAVVLEVTMDCVADLLRLAAAPGGNVWLTNVDELPRLESLAQRVDAAEGHRFLRWLLQTRGPIDAPVNKQLLLEALLVRWASLAGSGPMLPKRIR